MMKQRLINGGMANWYGRRVIWSFDAARTEARRACGESPIVVPLSRSVARPLSPIGAQVTKTDVMMV